MFDFTCLAVVPLLQQAEDAWPEQEDVDLAAVAEPLQVSPANAELATASADTVSIKLSFFIFTKSNPNDMSAVHGLPD